MSAPRYVTDALRTLARMTDSTAPVLKSEEADGRNDPEQRYALYRLCQCEECSGAGKLPASPEKAVQGRCWACRGEGRVRELVATCPSPEAVGVALVTLGREGEWDECPIGLLDRQPEGKSTGTWIVRPWLPSPRNVSDAGRLLQAQRRKHNDH